MGVITGVGDGMTVGPLVGGITVGMVVGALLDTNTLPTQPAASAPTISAVKIKALKWFVFLVTIFVSINLGWDLFSDMSHA